MPVVASSPAPAPAPGPRLSLPVSHRRLAPSAAVSVLVHGVIVGAVLWQGAVALARRGSGPTPGAAGAGVNFFALPAPTPAAMDVPAVSVLRLAPLPALAQITLDVPPLVPLVALPAEAPAQGPGGGGGTGGTAASGTGPGTGTGGADDYIFVASPRSAILPPLAKVPGSVAGRTYRIRFWVAGDGRVTRVEVDPPIRDEAYRREFLESMMAYKFYPARTRDGDNVASVYTISIQIGN